MTDLQDASTTLIKSDLKVRIGMIEAGRSVNPNQSINQSINQFVQIKYNANVPERIYVIAKHEKHD